ncbi:MAG: DUF1800 domain-containing protein [Vitreoscilla sp.]|nr:DUF1800 domain-containing protein [Vitreoscilla sp.]
MHKEALTPAAGRSPAQDPQPTPPNAHQAPATAALALGSAAALTACGGAGGDAPPPPPPPVAITDTQAARFLAQASLGATREQIARVRDLGYAGWLDEQVALPLQPTRWDWLVAKGYADIANRNSQAGFDPCVWRKLLTGPDTLRQRFTLALSEIIVVSIEGLVNGGGWKAFSAAAWLDMLEANAFGSLRTLLQKASTSTSMGAYLTFRGNGKANAATGTLPDENYARELMQLFTIGLVQLNPDGTPQLLNGAQQETYGQDDISGLARVFTGWDLDLAGGNTQTPDFHRRPMAQVASRYETGEKKFLGLSIAAGTDANTALTQALDHLYAHANVAPFWSRQLIQRLVTSNPSPAYVQRVAAVFANDGTGQRGNLGAVLKAILLDTEARGDAALQSTTAGKLREPLLRFTAWARACGVSSASDAWALGDTTDPATRLGQAPLRSPTVFNFFRPGYVPPNSGIATAQLVAPEFQITNESSVAGYVNYLQRAVAGTLGDLLPDYAALQPLADDAAALVAELNTVLAAGQLSAATAGSMTTALATMPAGTTGARTARIQAALVLVLAAPEFLVLK